MSEWRIGDLKVVKVLEHEDLWQGRIIAPMMTAENVLKEADWLVPRFANEQGRLRLSFHSLIVESGSLRILIDTCVGDDKQRNFPRWNLRHSSYLSDLEKAGYPRESIDRVVCTHLHIDHVGWNAMLQNGRWVPTFPNARYLVHRQEWEHWIDSDDAAIGDSVRPVFDAGLVDMVDLESKIGAEVSLEPSPGHTPGHVCVRISSRGEEAVITGDMVHHPIQFARPYWACFADADPELARRTRRAFAQRYADGPVMVLGTHFAAPTAGHIVTRDDAFYFQV
ncbi:MAG TPA: MBL fold metallo-hydrolase [Candidatus Binataceae bacterium]|nr:MBL fold metallo-hydrolase [Candidatus Binataceae bacterium]